jgi:acetyl-CoA synthetase
VAVLDADGELTAPGVIGEIHVMRGDRWVSTHDLGRVDSDGDFFHHGRADDVIISAGWTMSAVEIEDTLLSHPDVDECAAIGVADDMRGQVVRAYIVSRRRGEEAFSLELQQYAQNRLARHEYPRQVRFVTSLPKTPAGKVNRSILRAEARTELETSP